MKPLARTFAPRSVCVLLSARQFTTASSFPTQRSRDSSRSWRTVTPYIPVKPLRASGSKEKESNHASAKTSGSASHHHFRLLVQKLVNEYLRTLGAWSPNSIEHRSFGFESAVEYRQTAVRFAQAIEKCFTLAVVGKTGKADNPLFWNLRHGFIRGDTGGLNREIRYAFRSFVGHTKFGQGLSPSVKTLADFRYPHEWFPATRAVQRKVHLHIGPTNSGKTYHALKALENAKTGIYAGPLRLLAHEIYSRFTAKGRACALITGEEQRIPEDADIFLAACTVEMTPLNSLVDVAVIDEIQMIADEERGWAWTQAFLGVQAREVHLCGEERTAELIEKLCHKIGDECVVHRYNRLSPLEMARESLSGDFKNLRKGDAIVSFSRLNIHSLKAGIEAETGRRCAMVYGSLPPEVRAAQAALFNDPDNDYDFLVASDAIGMGLNLEIKRVVFDTTTKHDGYQQRFLRVPEVKQIGGRAGRYRTAAHAMRTDQAEANSEASSNTEADPGISAAVAPQSADGVQSVTSVGYVTTMQPRDLETVKEAFGSEAPPIKAAGIHPPSSVIEQFCSYFPPGTPLTHVLLKIRESAKLSDEFFLCNFDDMIQCADIIEKYPMPIAEKCVMLSAPVSQRTWGAMELFAKCVSTMSGGHILEINELDLSMIEVDPNGDKFSMRPTEYLHQLEALHQAIMLYLWLSYRFRGIFVSQQLAFHIKSLLEEKIQAHLDKIDYRRHDRRRRADMMADLLKQKESKRQRILGAEGVELGTSSDGTAGDTVTTNALYMDVPLEPREASGEAVRV